MAFAWGSLLGMAGQYSPADNMRRLSGQDPTTACPLPSDRLPCARFNRSIHDVTRPIVFQDQDGTWYITYGGWGHCNIVRIESDVPGFVPFDDGTTFREITPKGYVDGPLRTRRKDPAAGSSRRHGRVPPLGAPRTRVGQVVHRPPPATAGRDGSEPPGRVHRRAPVLAGWPLPAGCHHKRRRGAGSARALTEHIYLLL